MIELRGLTKRRGRAMVVDDVTAAIRPGRVTGLLGPNGAGKSSTLRMIVGLDRPTAGTATVEGRPYHALRDPLRVIGAQLDAGEARAGLTAAAHLRAAAATHGIGRGRVDEVLGVVGLDGVAGRRVQRFSLGMVQRLAIAAALLGDPPVLLFDEPVNGLDPDGVRWLRGFLRELAGQGRTVLLSSHLMREMEDTADHILVLARGRLLADAPLADLLGRAGPAGPVVRVRSPQPERLRAVLHAAGLPVTAAAGGALGVTGATPPEIGELAGRHGVVLHELAAVAGSLETAYLALTGALVDHRAGARATPLEVR